MNLRRSLHGHNSAPYSTVSRAGWSAEDFQRGAVWGFDTVEEEVGSGCFNLELTPAHLCEKKRNLSALQNYSSSYTQHPETMLHQNINLHNHSRASDLEAFSR